MRQYAIPIILPLFMSMVRLSSFAHDIAVENSDGFTIYYKYNGSGTLVVSFRGSHYETFENEYVGKLIIPASVEYNGVTYSVTGIGDRAFFNCKGLNTVTIPSSVTSIGDDVFGGCSNLRWVAIPSSVMKIGERPFYGCSCLYGVTIPSNVTSIGELAFYGCSSLPSITIPEGVTSIGNEAFKDCIKLTSVVIPSSVTSIGLKAFLGCRGLTTVTIPEGVMSIDEFTFGECNELASVVIPSSVTCIGYYAFGGCNALTSVNIPSCVTTIENSAFYGCSGLTSVKVCNEVPVAINENTFSNHANATLYVPYGCKDAYKAADGWKDFKEIVEMPANSSLAISDANGLVGCTFNLPISMTNEDEITAMQFELSLPEGISVAGADLTDRKDGHTIDYTLQENVNYQFTVFSSSSKAINGNEGDVANISLNISNSVAPGNYTIQLKNIELTTTSAIAILQPDLSATLTVSNIKLGDVNGDDKMSITDAVGIVNYILGNASSNFHPEAADVNGDNRVSITDAVALVNIILNQSASVKELRKQEIEIDREPQ